LLHIKKSKKPFALSPILVDHSAYDKYHRKGISGFILRKFPASTNEYLKTIFRWFLGKDSLQTKSYIWKGHKKMVKEILERASLLLPNSQSEYEDLKKIYSSTTPYAVVPCGIDPSLFKAESFYQKDPNLVICAARIEGRKNQLNLIKALNKTSYQLILIGDAAPNQSSYFNDCKKAAADNVIFTGKILQAELVQYYKKAKVHVLASWFESCGLSSLEAAAMGCNIVITDKGYTRDYFGDDAFYCDPGNIESIRQAIEDASKNNYSKELQERIFKEYTWANAAEITLKAYQKIKLS
jgi:glycosyltransferase involved in cell wall biosynthesis